MTLLPAAVLLLCTAAMCFTTTAAGYVDPLLRNTKTRSHGVQKRQVTQSVVCSSALTPELCTNGQLQELINLMDQCNQSSSNDGTQNLCRRNSNGLFCDGEAFVLAEKFEIDSSTTCDVNEVCSTACRNLILDARDRIGCCINIFNDSNTFVPRQYSSTLWSNCRVGLVTQECEPSTLNFRVVPFDTTCNTATAYDERFQSYLCRSYVVNTARDIYSRIEECEDFDGIIGTSCNANRNRTYCSLLSLSRNFSDARSDCADTSTCDPRCIQTLTNITNTVGCCFMDRYNTTYEHGWLGYEFWSRCGLESPGLCEEYLNDAAVILKASNTAIILAVTAAVLLLLTEIWNN